MYRSAFFLVAIAVLSACGVRGSLAPVPESVKPEREKTILVSTSRRLAPAPDFFSNTRSYQTNYSKFAVSIPPDREPGDVQYPTGRDVDPDTEFLVASATRLKDKSAFITAINAEVANLPPGADQGFLFVHGFNTNSAEAIIRATALAEDTGREFCTFSATASHPTYFPWRDCAAAWRRS